MWIYTLKRWIQACVGRLFALPCKSYSLRYAIQVQVIAKGSMQLLPPPLPACIYVCLCMYEDVCEYVCVCLKRRQGNATPTECNVAGATTPDIAWS